MIPLTLKKLILLFDRKDKLTILFLFVLNIITSIFEILGIASIVPFIGLISDPEFLQKYTFLDQIYLYFGLTYKQSVIYTGIAIIVLFVLSNLTSAYNLWRTVKFTAKQSHKISVSIMNKYLSQKYNFFVNSDISSISKNILSEASILSENFLMPALQLITKLTLLISISILLFIVNIEVFLYSLSTLILLYILIYKSLRDLIIRYGKERLISNDKRFKYVNDSLKSIKDVKFYNVEEYYVDQFSHAQKDFSYLTAKNTLFSLLPKYLLEIFAIGGLFSITIYLISIDTSIKDFLPTLSIFILAAYRLLPLIQQVYVNFTTMKFYYPVLHVLDEINNLDSSNITRPSERIDFNKTIELKDICFSYDRKNILNNISFSFNKSSITGLIGKTGVGKTTLLDLLLGFNIPTSGEILLDQVRLDNNDIYKLCNTTGYVSQNITFLDNTIASNIAFGVSNEKINYKLIDELIDCVQLRELIDSLEHGINTNIGENGIKLSGGQCQRIGIARALYLKPTLLIFDEATNAIDSETETSLIKTIREYTKDTITIIIITHRLSSISLCDKVLVLNSKNILSYDKDEVTTELLEDLLKDTD
tara:strand:- start:8062 stop:9834 length:1773 start_codon:yes stop_codon:yes gene_type:complete